MINEMYTSINNIVKILILEDNPDDIELMKFALKKEISLIEIDAVDSKRSFIEAIEKKAYDIIISDYDLPAYNGEQAVKDLRRLGLDIPVIIISGTVGEEKAVDLIRAGATDFILKNNPHRLSLKVKRALNEYEEHRKLIEAQNDLEKRSSELKERVKELTCLTSISNLLDQKGLDINELVVRLSNEIIVAFTEPENTYLHFSFCGFSFISDNFPDEAIHISAPIMVNDVLEGEIIVAHKNEDFNNVELFLPEEKELIASIAQNISGFLERNNNQKKLEENQLQLKQAQSIAKFGSYVIDINTNKLEWSDELYRIYGYEPNSVEPTFDLFFELIHPDHLEKFNRETIEQELFITGKYTIEHWILTFDNKEKFVHSETLIKYNDSNEPIRIIGTVQDITESKLAEEKLKKSEEFYRNILENSYEGVSITDAEGIVTYQSPANKSITGYDDIELMGTHVLELIHPNDQLKSADIMKESLDNPGKYVFTQVRYKNKDGNYRQYQIKGINLLHNSAVNGIVINFNDITEKVKIETEIRKSQELLSQLFNNSPIGIVLMDNENKILKVNDAFENIFDYTRKELAGRNVDDALAPLELMNEATGISKKVAAGNIIEWESYRKRKDGSNVPVLIYAVPLEVEKEFIGSYGLIVDISERKRSEEAMKELTKELMRYNEDLQNFAYVASHNLRAPVANLSGLMNLMNRNDLADSENEMIIDRIDRSIQNLDRTLHDLVEVISSRKNIEDQVETLYFDEVFKHITESLEKEIINSEAVIKTDFSAVNVINYPSSHLNSIIMNLLTNAIKYRDTDKQPMIDVTTYIQDDFICLSIADNGIGIDLEKNQNKLFKMYQRLQPAQKIEGKGLGLYIVKMQVESMGGTVEVISTPGVGTRFIVYLKKDQRRN